MFPVEISLAAEDALTEEMAKMQQWLDSQRFAHPPLTGAFFSAEKAQALLAIWRAADRLQLRFGRGKLPQVHLGEFRVDALPEISPINGDPATDGFGTVHAGDHAPKRPAGR